MCTADGWVLVEGTPDSALRAAITEKRAGAWTAGAAASARLQLRAQLTEGHM